MAKDGLSGFEGWSALECFLAGVAAARLSAGSVSRSPA